MRRIAIQADTLRDKLEAACILEAAARKPGNVHPECSFRDLTFEDFVRSAQITAPIVAEASTSGVGNVVLDAVRAVRRELETNTNLGIVLLLAPLAAIPSDSTCAAGIAGVLARLTLDDARQIYQAIREAQPGGLGQTSEHDVASEPRIGIVEAMTLAADRDLVARQYATNYSDVLILGRDAFLNWSARGHDWETAIIGTQLELLSRHPDSLIARKCGAEVAEEAARQAAAILKSGWPDSSESAEKLWQFDRWLRADGNRRNPGTTADLLAAVVFALIRDGAWTPPKFIDINDAGTPSQTPPER